MNSHQTRKWLRFAGVAAALFAVVIVLRGPVQIQFHRAFVQQGHTGQKAPTKLRDYFSARTLFWLATGSPDRQQAMTRGRAHEAALVRLGYFERRSYRFPAIDTELSREVRQSNLRDPLCFFVFNAGQLEVTAHSEDFRIIEPIIKRRLQIQ
jgi:hypothetical protein